MDCTVLRGAQSLGSKHFCEIIDRGKQPDRFRFIIMKLVDLDLGDYQIYATKVWVILEMLAMN